MLLEPGGTLNAATTSLTMTQQTTYTARRESHTVVIGGTFADGNVLALTVNDGVNDRYLGHFNAPGKVTFLGRCVTVTAQLLDQTNGLTGIAAGTVVTVRTEHSERIMQTKRHARVNRAIRTAEAGTAISLSVYPPVPSHVNQLPDGSDRHTSEHTFELDGQIGGGVGLDIEMVDGAGVETLLATVTNAMLPWQYPLAGVVRGDLVQIQITVPAGFTSTGLIFTSCHSIEEA